MTVTETIISPAIQNTIVLLMGLIASGLGALITLTLSQRRDVKKLLTISEVFSQNIGQVKFLLPAMEIIIIWGMFAHWVNCLHHKAHYDPLLKIYNRQYLDNILHGLADINLGKKLSIMMCDIDHFKKVNDTYGHAAGDAVLFNTAQLIRDAALPEGVVCRYGGEEIMVIVRDKTGPEAKLKGEKIRKAVKAAAVKVKGKTEGKKIYWPVLKKDYTKTLEKSMKAFSAGLELYYRGDWRKANQLFKRCNLPVGEVFAERTADSTPPRNWNGIWEMKTK